MVAVVEDVVTVVVVVVGDGWTVVVFEDFVAVIEDAVTVAVWVRISIENVAIAVEVGDVWVVVWEAIPIIEGVGITDICIGVIGIGVDSTSLRLVVEYVVGLSFRCILSGNVSRRVAVLGVGVAVAWPILVA